MHSPETVAFEIYLGKKKKKNGHYRTPLFTIWHIDPEKRTLGTRPDDSCGWFSPPYTEEEKEAVEKLAKAQYEQIFAKTVAEAQGKSYAYICYDQDCYGMLYWSWRAFNAMHKEGWQYGKHLSAKELDEIFKLATNPVDNFQSNYHGIKDLRSFTDIFFLIYRAYRRFNRKWWQHPRWHIHHWRINCPIWRDFYRKYFEKCSKCNRKGFGNMAAYSDWDGKKIWCEKCNGTSIAKSPPPTDQPSISSGTQ